MLMSILVQSRFITSAISNGHINKILHNRIIVIITVFFEFYTFPVSLKEHTFY